MAQRFVFPEAKRVEVQVFAPGKVEAGDVRVRIAHSLMSTGTENTAFNGIFDPASHWGDYVQYPFYPGYSSSGEVIEIGAGVTSLRPGDRIFTMWPHASEHVLREVAAFPVPDDIDLAAANWAALAGVAYVGIRRARIAVGESTVVIGAGPVGQMVIRWAALAGSGRVIAIDPAADRLDLAMAGGATETIAAPVVEALADLRVLNDGRRAHVVIDATGRAASFAEGLALVADFGRMVLVGDTGDPTRQHLTSDVIGRGVEVIAAHGNYMPYVMGQVAMGAREGAANDKVLAERVLGWRAFSAMFFDLVRQGRFPLEGLISHTFPAEQAAEGYTLVNERRGETMGVSFTW